MDPKILQDDGGVVEMRFAASALSMLLLVSILGFGQNTLENGEKKQIPELAPLHHLHGFVYCPDGETESAEMILRSINRFAAQIPHVFTDKSGYFDFGNVPVGKYELVVKNKCLATAASVNKFKVTVTLQPGTAAWCKDSLPEEVVIKLNKQSSPEISYRLKKNVSCG